MRTTPAAKLSTLLAAEAETVDTTTFTLSVPIYVVLGEAIRIAGFVRHYWRTRIDPKTKVVLLPGLEQVRTARFRASIADELVLLHDRVQSAQTAHVLVPRDESRARAELVLDEITAVLQWRCDETRLDDAHTKFRVIAERHREQAHDPHALADALADYSDLAIELRPELTQIGAFDVNLLDEAGQLVVALRERFGRDGKTHLASGLLDQRNRYAALLIARMNYVRAAARYVFRHHDDIIAQVDSAYERRRRAAAMSQRPPHAVRVSTPTGSCAPSYAKRDRSPA